MIANNGDSGALEILFERLAFSFIIMMFKH